MGRGKESVSSLLIFSSSKEKSATGYVGLGSRQIRTCTVSTSGFRTIAWKIRAFEGQVFNDRQSRHCFGLLHMILSLVWSSRDPPYVVAHVLSSLTGSSIRCWWPPWRRCQRSVMSLCPVAEGLSPVCLCECMCEVDQFMRCQRPLITPALCTVKPSAASQIELSRGKWGSTSHTAGTWFENEDRKKLLNTIQNLIWSYG